jgi:hypothetical protein
MAELRARLITLNRYPLMKRFALSRTLPVLGALAFAAACTDATSPNAHSSLRPGAPTPAIQGNVPPPPTRTVVVISVGSHVVVVGTFTGVYFANGGNIESVAASAELADAALGFNGTAWLRLDNTQTLGSIASANARFQVTRSLSTDPNYSGRGTLVINDFLGEPHTITIDRVTFFAPNPNCLPGALCAVIEFDASVDGEPGHHGTAQAFDREVCNYVVIPEEDEGSVFVCPLTTPSRRR